MKKLLPLILVLIASHTFAQRTLEWSIGEVQLTCNGDSPTEICYPVLVSINDESNTPKLATSTMRFFFDAYLLSNFSAENIENNYTVSGQPPSNPNLGIEFDFSDDQGVWEQFDIIASNTPIDLTTAPTHVLDFCFDITAAGSTEFSTTGFLCAPIVFDNNHTDTLTEDKSYVIFENEGIDGSYFLNNDSNTAIKADDEVLHYLWTADPAYLGFISPSQADVQIGTSNDTGCIEDVCECPDAGMDGTLDICAGETPTDADLFAALIGTPDTGGVWTTGGGASVETFSFLGYNEDASNCPQTINTVTASTATVNDEITIIFEDINIFQNFQTSGSMVIYMYGGLQTDGVNDFQGAPLDYNDLASHPTLSLISSDGNVFAAPNTYITNVNLSQLYTDVADGENVTGFNIIFQSQAGGGVFYEYETCELFIDLVDALKDSNASGTTYTYTIAAANGCPEVSSTVTVAETIDACFSVLEWSIDTVDITCGTNNPTQICYKLMVATDENPDSMPQLATSSMRLFYDSHLLENLNIPSSSIENGYTVNPAPTESGFGLAADTGPYGTIFGFSSEFGNWVQFEIIANNGTPIDLSSTPTHVLDLCFDVSSAGNAEFSSSGFLCAPIVFDNNQAGWGNGISEDDGYLQDPDEGITGNYYVNGITGNPKLADDEVLQYLWTENVDTDGVTPIVFDGVVDSPADRTGSTDVTGCIQQDCALPIELLSFNLKKLGNSSELHWVTASELNNDRFEIERSGDGIHYFKIGAVKGAGNTTRETSYSFIDNQPVKGVNYYRLKQVDFDNNFNYSPIRKLDFASGKREFKLYQNVPNPFAGETSIGFNLPRDMSAVIRVFDATGKLVVVFDGNYKAGYNAVVFNRESLSLNGIYYYQLTADTYSDSKKMIIR